MYYFEKQGNIINKYNVEYDSEALKKLNYEIINNYSTIIHKEEKRTGGMPFCSNENFQEYRNIKSTQVGVHEYIDCRDEPIYLYTYDKYLYPRISVEIKNLLNGDITAIKRIFTYETTKEELKLELSKLTSSFNIIDKSDSDEPLDYLESQINELNKIKYALNNLSCKFDKLEKEKNILDKYGDELKRLIKVELVDSINEEEINKVSKFLDINLIPFSTNDKISNNVKKQLKSMPEYRKNL